MTDALSATGLVAGYRHGRQSNPVVTLDRLAARRGELVAVIGPNGAGKSTLLRTLIGAQPALAGNIELDGIALARLDGPERARRVGVVLTERVDAGMMTVRDVVGLGRHPHTGWSGRLGGRDVAVARASAERLGVDALWTRRFAELSDGQRQRVLVARALAQEPAVLVLDEPTAFLDVTGRIELTAALADLAHDDGLAVVASTHDLDLALANADKVWLVHRGEVVVGSPEAVAVDGLLGEAFDNDRVAFDRATGSFAPRRRGTQAIVTSSAVLARLVHRLGGTPVESARDHPDAWVIESLDGGWVLRTDGGTFTVATIDELSVMVRGRLRPN